MVTFNHAGGLRTIPKAKLIALAPVVPLEVVSGVTGVAGNVVKPAVHVLYTSLCGVRQATAVCKYLQLLKVSSRQYAF